MAFAFEKRFIAFLIILSVCSFGYFYTNDPLRKLERIVRATPSMGAIAETPKDDAFYREAIILQSIARLELGSRVDYDREGEGWLGRSDEEERVIYISHSLKWTARFETLAHELGHFLTPPGIESHADREFFAETVAALVLHNFGDEEGFVRSAQYISGFKGSLHILRDYRKELLRVSDFLSLRD